MMESPIDPTSATPPPAAKIGRPPQWTDSKSRKLARLYMYTTLPIEKIIKVLDDGIFKPGRNSAQKTLHKMLGNDPRYLRPDSRQEMNERIGGLSASNSRRRAKVRPPDTIAEGSEPREHHEQHEPSRLRAQSAPERSIVDEAISFNTAEPEHKYYGFDSPAPTQSLPHSSPIDGGYTWSEPSVASYGSPPGIHSQPVYYQPPVFVPSRLAHTGTMFSASTTASTPSIRDLKHRMSISSTTFAKQVSSLLRQWTIGSQTNASNNPPHINTLQTGALSTDNFQSDQQAYAAANMADAAHALPGDFFMAFNNREVRGGQPWCDIAGCISQLDGFWVVPPGQFSKEINELLQQPDAENLDIRDCFGNTPLHLFAACPLECKPVLEIVRMCPAQQLLATNTAGQTFLHVLASHWFYALEHSAPLMQLLAHLCLICPQIFPMCDVYGRTFFHHLQKVVLNPGSVISILHSCNQNLTPRRDAFDSKFAIDGLLPPTRMTQALSPLAEEMLSSPSSASSPVIRVDMFVQFHAGLLRIINESFNNPSIEDSSGRNGLHCLAQVIVDKDTLQERRSSLATLRPNKRKYDKKDKPEGEDQGPLARRLTHLRCLLEQTRIDVNHYDKNGTTVLMAFVDYIQDQDEDKHKNLVAIITCLLDAGARIEARNRKGETALLVAARLGRKTALRTLLERGANPHARDVDGRGVLQVIDENLHLSQGDVKVYGRLEACRVLLTGRYKDDWGGEISQNPTVADEWRVRGVKSED